MQTYPARNKYPECFLDDNKILSFCRPILFCTLPYDSILNPTLWFYFAPYPIQHSKFKIVNELKDPGVLFFGSRNTEEIHRRSYLGAKWVRLQQHRGTMWAENGVTTVTTRKITRLSTVTNNKIITVQTFIKGRNTWDQKKNESKKWSKIKGAITVS